MCVRHTAAAACGADPTADRPTYEFYVGHRRVRVRRDEHRAAGVLAVIESQKKRAALVHS